MTAGNEPPDSHLFLVDFSKAQTTFEAHLSVPYSEEGEPDRWVVVELWKKPGAKGQLLASQTYKVGEVDYEDIGFLASVSVSGGKKFRSVRMGSVLSTDPDCRVGACDGGDGNYYWHESTADDIRVFKNRHSASLRIAADSPPVPESSAVVAFSLGALLVGAVLHKRLDSPR